MKSLWETIYATELAVNPSKVPKISGLEGSTFFAENARGLGEKSGSNFSKVQKNPKHDQTV